MLRQVFSHASREMECRIWPEKRLLCILSLLEFLSGEIFTVGGFQKKKPTIFRNAFTFLCLKVLRINPSHNTASSAIPACSHHVYTSVEKASVIQTFDAFSFDI